MRRLNSAAFLLIALAASVALMAEGAQHPKAIQGDDLRSLFANHELSDQVHFFFQFHYQGRLTGVSMGEKLIGTWKTKGRRVCLIWGHQLDAGGQCYEVRKEDNTVLLLQDNVVILYGNLVAIKQEQRW